MLKCGRGPKDSDVAVPCWLMHQKLFGLGLRQTTGLVPSVGRGGSEPDFSALCRRRLDLKVQRTHTQPSGPVLAGGFDVVHPPGQGEWKCQKHEPERQRPWIQLHLGIDAQTRQIRALCMALQQGQRCFSLACQEPL